MLLNQHRTQGIEMAGRRASRACSLLLLLFLNPATAEAGDAPEIPDGLTAAQLTAMVQAATDADRAADPNFGDPITPSTATLIAGVLAHLDKVAPADLRAVLDQTLPAAADPLAVGLGANMAETALQVARDLPPDLATEVMAAAVRAVAGYGDPESLTAVMTGLVQGAGAATESNPDLAKAILAGVTIATADAAAQQKANDAGQPNGTPAGPITPVADRPDLIADALMAALANVTDPEAKAAMSASLAAAIARLPDPSVVVEAIVQTGIADPGDVKQGPNGYVGAGQASDIKAVLTSVVSTLAEEGRTADLASVAKVSVLTAASGDFMLANDLAGKVAAAIAGAPGLDQAALDAIGEGMSAAVRQLSAKADTIEASLQGVDANDSQHGPAQYLQNSVASVRANVGDAVKITEVAKVDTSVTKPGEATKQTETPTTNSQSSGSGSMIGTRQSASSS